MQESQMQVTNKFLHFTDPTHESFMNNYLHCFSRISRQVFAPPRFRSTLLQRTKGPDSTRTLANKTYNMAAEASPLSKTLNSLSMTDDVPKYPNCYPEINPVDKYRAHLTSILTGVTGVDSAIIYPALQWTQTLEKGDLVLPVPALRVKGKKPLELAAEWVEKVDSSH